MSPISIKLSGKINMPDKFACANAASPMYSNPEQYEKLN
jgi:hypothetical protein